jgi:hypothetical protein
MSLIEKEIERFKRGEEVIYSENFIARPESKERINNNISEFEKFCEIKEKFVGIVNGYLRVRIKAIKK